MNGSATIQYCNEFLTSHSNSKTNTGSNYVITNNTNRCILMRKIDYLVLKKYLFLCLMDKISYDDFMNLQKCHNELIPDRAIYSYYSLTNT